MQGKLKSPSVFLCRFLPNPLTAMATQAKQFEETLSFSTTFCTFNLCYRLLSYQRLSLVQIDLSGGAESRPWSPSGSHAYAKSLLF